MKSIIFLALIIITNAVAQTNLSVTYDIKTNKELKQFLEENGLDKSRIKHRYIHIPGNAGNYYIARKYNNKLYFYDDDYNVIKTVNMKPEYTQVQISKNGEYVVIKERNDIHYPSEFKCALYNHKGEKLYEEVGDKKISVAPNGFLYKQQGGLFSDARDKLFIYSERGELLNVLDLTLGQESLDYDKKEKLLFLIVYRGNNKYLDVIDENAQLLWDYPIFSRTVETMIKVNKKDKKVIIGKGDQIIILNYDGTEDYIIPVKYEYGSYLDLSNDGKTLAAFNDEINTPNNAFYIIDLDNKKIIVEKKLNEIGKRKLIRHVVFSDNNKYILIENTISPNIVNYLIYDNYCNLVYRYNNNISCDVDFLVKGNIAYIIGQKSIKAIQLQIHNSKQ